MKRSNVNSATANRIYDTTYKYFKTAEDVPRSYTDEPPRQAGPKSILYQKSQNNTFDHGKTYKYLLNKSNNNEQAHLEVSDLAIKYNGRTPGEKRFAEEYSQKFQNILKKKKERTNQAI